MTPYEGPERRRQSSYSSEFEGRMYTFMGEVREHIKNQNARCANHSARLEDLAERATDIEQAIGYRKGDERTIHVRVASVETFKSRFMFVFQALAWISAVGGVLYAGFVLLVRSAMSAG